MVHIKGHLIVLEDTSFPMNFALYVETWFTAPITNDALYKKIIWMLYNMEQFHSIETQTSDVAVHKMKRLLWYIIMSAKNWLDCHFFWHGLSWREETVSALRKPQMKTDLKIADPKTFRTFQEKTLSEFMTQQSMHLYATPKIGQDFLSYVPKCALD